MESWWSRHPWTSCAAAVRWKRVFWKRWGQTGRLQASCHGLIRLTASRRRLHELATLADIHLAAPASPLQSNEASVNRKRDRRAHILLPRNLRCRDDVSRRSLYRIMDFAESFRRDRHVGM